ncbi:Threonylcarbamoyl-AMP synthase [Penicillium longicatenatum]|uniref:Threonylcarbamoyl-AMP synthase n=1 Tax=Penicillium longicatenatum TaxID=1561947 RepID=UPI00254659DB|nr:Threonylcarbamoyl-AMP synthase [Penicillium longicatenatum]KAJ5657745.1 Threonylcarbamoyl-AMP synthase [Penicillium longicatenatum]
MADAETRVVSVQRLNQGPGARSLAEWWADERESQTPEYKAIEEAANLLRKHDIPVAFPTETVYGLGADATRSGAVQGIYRAKQRPSDNPLIVHVDSVDMLDRLLNPSQSSPSSTKTPRNPLPSIYTPLIERFWPGPLTIILPNPSGSDLAPEVTSNLTTFGARMPSSPLARLLIHATDRPLAAPSANASTKPSPTTAQHVLHDLKGRIDLILDGGPSGVGVESTVVDGLCDPPAVLRPGGIGIEELREVPGWENVTVGYQDGTLDVKEIPRAPGMKYRHYSPKARVVLFKAGSNPAGVTRHVQNDLKDTAIGAHNIGIVRTREWAQGLGLAPDDVMASTITPISAPINDLFSFPIPVQPTGSSNSRLKIAYDYHLGSETVSIAQGLFAALRALDELDVDVIYVEGISDSDGDLAAAVMNRLRKAAGTEMKV